MQMQGLGKERGDTGQIELTFQLEGSSCKASRASQLGQILHANLSIGSDLPKVATGQKLIGTHSATLPSKLSLDRKLLQVELIGSQQVRGRRNRSVQSQLVQLGHGLLSATGELEFGFTIEFPSQFDSVDQPLEQRRNATERQLLERDFQIPFSEIKDI
jgi:hypothetical protein